MARLFDAFQQVLAHPEDRRALVFLLSESDEVRYEALRRGVGEHSPQMFKYCVDRLSKAALINRRLVPLGKRFESHISLTRGGKEIAETLVSLSERGTLPRNMPASHREELQLAFVAAAPRA